MQPKLFVETENSKDFKQYLPVNVNTTFETLAPNLGLAEEQFIKPLLGTTLYNEVVSRYQTDDLPTPWNTLLNHLKFGEIHIAYYLGYSVLSVQIDDGGASSKSGEGQRLFRYQEENLKNYFRETGFNILDSALDDLYTHPDIFPSFAESTFYKKAQQTLIPTTEILNECYNINMSRLVFLKIKYYIQMVEDIELRHHLGNDFVSELMNADPTESKYNAIIPYIRKYIVYQSIAKGIGELKKMPTEKGLIFESVGNFSFEGYNVTPVESKEIQESRRFYADTADQYLSTLTHYLKEHPNDYPNYNTYTKGNAPTNRIVHRDNKGKKMFFTPVK
jgi:hypothetical protein